MKQCPKCNAVHTTRGTFCSRSCANSREFSTEEKQRRSIALKGKTSTKSPEVVASAVAKIRETWRKKYLERDFDSLGPDLKRRRVFEEQDNCCSNCKLSVWFDKPIALELDHKDGNTQNNNRENLERAAKVKKLFLIFFYNLSALFGSN